MRAQHQPDEIGRYRVVKVLGVGGMAVVYRAFDPILDRHVAVKVLELDEYELTVAVRHAVHEKFLDESHLLARNPHPDLVHVYDADRQNEKPFIVMELVEGETLLNRLQKGFLSRDEIIKTVTTVAGVIDHLRDCEIVHRDIKPANIMLRRRDERAVVLDLGVAKDLDEPSLMTKMHQVAGTPPYMSPELLGLMPHDSRSDQYSLAVVTYEMLTGRLPFDNLNREEFAPISDLTHLQPSMPVAAVNRVLRKALSKNPADRYEQCAEFAKDLETAFPIGPNSGRQRVAVVASMLVALLVSFFLGYLSRSALNSAPLENGKLKVINLTDTPIWITHVSVVRLSKSGKLVPYEDSKLRTIEPHSPEVTLAGPSWDGSVISYELILQDNSAPGSQPIYVGGIWNGPCITLPSGARYVDSSLK